MLIRNVFVLVLSGVMFVLGANPASAQGRPHAYCDSGDRSRVQGASGSQTFECVREQVSWVFQSFRNCPPGTTMRNPPTEANDGGDLCNAVGGVIAGPALLCGPGQRLVLVRNGRDRCEARQTRWVNRPVRIRN